MSPVFQIVDSKENSLNVRNISKDGYHLYQLTSAQGHYAEIYYRREDKTWIITFSPDHTPQWEYDIQEVGKLIKTRLLF